MGTLGTFLRETTHNGNWNEINGRRNMTRRQGKIRWVKERLEYGKKETGDWKARE